jgi:hypothetical protein
MLALAMASLIALSATASSVFGRAPERGDAPIDAKVLGELAAGGDASFWVVLKQEADLRAASSMGRRARGEFVYERLRAAADTSQSGLRALLRSRRAGFRSFWIANAIRVTGNESLLREIAARPEVKEVLAPHTYRLPELEPVMPTSDAGVDEVAWGLTAIKAPDVWAAPFNDRGEGIVVANVDSGVQFDHPALVAQYRGNLGDGGFDHNYDWFDPSGCAPIRQSSPATTAATARTRWGRWSVTTGIRERIRSGSLRTRGGSRQRVARRAPALNLRCSPPGNGSLPRPTSRATIRDRTSGRTS